MITVVPGLLKHDWFEKKKCFRVCLSVAMAMNNDAKVCQSNQSYHRIFAQHASNQNVAKIKSWH